MQNYNELNELFELTIQDNHGFNGFNGLSGAARILRPEGAKCGGSIRGIRYKYVLCAQPKIRIIREIRGRKIFRSIRSIRCSKIIRVIL